MVGEALADDTLQHFVGAHGVADFERRAVVIAELELGEVAVKMLRRAVLIDALHAALEDAESAFNGVAVDGAIFAADILAKAVLGGAMLGELAAKNAIHRRFVGHKPRLARDIGAHDGMDFVFGELVESERAHGAGFTVNERENAVLVSGAAKANRVRLVADIGFVHLDSATARTKGHSKVASAHRFADTVRHEPSGLESDAENAVKLVARNALLAPGDQVHRLKPKAHRNLAVLKDGANLDGEGLAALVALVRADAGRFAPHLGQALHATTVRANGAVRPKARLNVSVGRFFVVKVRGGKVRHWKAPFVETYLRRNSGYVKYNNAKIADEEIAKGRLDLLADMRTKLGEAIDNAAREVFARKLEAKTISFKLSGAANDWEMDPWVEVEFTPGVDTWMRNADDEDLQLSLFDQAIKNSELNGFEREVALYLDGSDALAWWWRLASRGAWGLQGWRRHKVYPDFLMRLSGDGKRLFVLETKGKQLDNADAAFKRDLMQTLQDAYQKSSPGEVELFDDSPDQVRFKMLMQEADWRTQLKGALVAK